MSLVADPEPEPKDDEGGRLKLSTLRTGEPCPGFEGGTVLCTGMLVNCAGLLVCCPTCLLDDTPTTLDPVAHISWNLCGPHIFMGPCEKLSTCWHLPRTLCREENARHRNAREKARAKTHLHGY